MSKKKPKKRRTVTKKIGRKQQLSAKLATLAMRGGASSFTATKTEVPDPGGMMPSTWDVSALLILDFDPTAENVDETETPTALVLPSNITFDLVPVSGTSNKHHSGSTTGLATEPTSVMATFRFRTVPLHETVNF